MTSNVEITTLDEIPREMADEIINYLNTSKSRWVEIDLNWALITIENRPIYCDRGCYSLKASHKIKHFIECNIDSLDGFPRYYFNFNCLIEETNSFIAARRLKINTINYGK